MTDDYDAADDYPEDDDDRPFCFRCDGVGEVTCHCGGDMCLCGREDVPCPGCGGDGRVSPEMLERQLKAHREIMTAIWGEGWDKPVPQESADG